MMVKGDRTLQKWRERGWKTGEGMLGNLAEETLASSVGGGEGKL